MHFSNWQFMRRIRDADGDINLNTIQSPLLVSLGSHCEIAGMMRAYQIRKTAFPFDWLVTLDHEHYLEILKDDFEHFLDTQYFIQHPIYPTILENCFYEIEFRHDWPFSDFTINPERCAQQIQEMNSKYNRRIGRFRKLKNYPGKVIFFRLAFDVNNDSKPFWGKPDQSKVTYEQALSLKRVLDEYFPDLQFTLVIVNYTDDYIPRIDGIKNVREFKIRKSNKHEDYKNMFELLKVM